MTLGARAWRVRPFDSFSPGFYFAVAFDTMETVMNRATLRALTLGAAVALAAGPAMAEGDPAKGKKVFAKCKVCHTLKKGKNKPCPGAEGAG